MFNDDGNRGNSGWTGYMPRDQSKSAQRKPKWPWVLLLGLILIAVGFYLAS